MTPLAILHPNGEKLWKNQNMKNLKHCETCFTEGKTHELVSDYHKQRCISSGNVWVKMLRSYRFWSHDFSLPTVVYVACGTLYSLYMYFANVVSVGLCFQNV